MYTKRNFKNKEELLEAYEAGEKIEIESPESGIAILEGPHFPDWHNWYATAWVKDGVIERLEIWSDYVHEAQL